MGKRLSFSTRSFGSDGPLPDLEALAGWVSRKRGEEGDITSFLLEQELLFQIDAGLTYPCAGGTFSFGRWMQAVANKVRTLQSGEEERESEDLTRETELVTTLLKGVWMAVPAPHALSLPATLSTDSEEGLQDIYEIYSHLMRDGRDGLLGGHILIGSHPKSEELEALADRKVFFFAPYPSRKSLATLLEYQSTVAIRPEHLGLLQDLMNEYEVHRIVIIDPEESDLRNALTIREQDQILCGGYCKVSCKEYWKNLVEKSAILK
jgi:hypothetical protein